jgi:hypothetical protein
MKARKVRFTNPYPADGRSLLSLPAVLKCVRPPTDKVAANYPANVPAGPPELNLPKDVSPPSRPRKASR